MTDIKALNQLVFEWVGRREFDKTHVPGCITDNLNPNFPMRPYQHSAFQYFVNYWQEPFDGKPMSVGNGVMVALGATDKAQVDRIYKLALSLGGTDEGAPGPRGDGGFYAAYFRDPEGNKLNAFVMG